MESVFFPSFFMNPVKPVIALSAYFVPVFSLTESGLARDDADLYSDTSSVGDNSEYASSTSSRGSRSTG